LQFSLEVFRQFVLSELPKAMLIKPLKFPAAGDS